MGVQLRTLEGRPHYVAPVVMLTVGVHAGSHGPVYYAAGVLADSAPLWNGRPVVAPPNNDHDRMAGDPEVFDGQRIGTLFNTGFDGRRLTAEAWIDAERVGRVAPRVRDALAAGRVLEVSTGMVGELADGAVANGAGYAVPVARLYPDHLAVLPGGVGACSIAAGCGLLRV